MLLRAKVAIVGGNGDVILKKSVYLLDFKLFISMKNFVRFILTVAMTLSVTGCRLGMIVDWAPVGVTFYITNSVIRDAPGDDLLDPHSDLFIGDQIKVTYRGQDYTYSLPTKEYFPVFSGLTISQDSSTGRYIANFGELSGADDYDDDFIITLPDGKTTTIHYKRKVNDFRLKAKEHWYLDNVEVDSLPVTIYY